MGIVLFLDEIYLQTCAQYQGSNLVSVEGERSFFKRV